MPPRKNPRRFSIAPLYLSTHLFITYWRSTMLRNALDTAADRTDPLGMATLLEKFLDSLRVKNFSDETVHDRQVYATWFIDWAEQRGLAKPGEITKPILEHYQRHLFNYRKRNGEPLSVQSQHHHIVVLRVWFKWL